MYRNIYWCKAENFPLYEAFPTFSFEHTEILRFFQRKKN